MRVFVVVIERNWSRDRLAVPEVESVWWVRWRARRRVGELQADPSPSPHRVEVQRHGVRL